MTNNPNNKTYIPKRFANKVINHVLKVCMNYPSPLILIIQGEPGSGKSFQTREVLNSHNLKYEVLDSSLLSGELEGDSIKLLKEAYITQSSQPKVSAIIIDDFDMSIANQKDNFQRTSNSDILNTFLMHLCDNPTQIGRKIVKPVPLILTGNNFSSMYAPLLRHGRADIFDWHLTKEEKLDIVYKIFFKYDLTKKDIETLIIKYPNKPIAFFTQINLALLDNLAESLLDYAKDKEFERSELELLGEKLLDSKINNITYKEILGAAERVNISVKDYL